MRRPVIIALVVAGLLLVVVVGVLQAVGASTRRYRAPSEAMQPTIRLNDRFTSNRDAFDGDGKPRIGDVVIFHPPKGADEGNTCGGSPRAGAACATPTPGAADVEFVKRVVAGPGDGVAIRAGKVVRNGRPVAEPYAQRCPEASDGCTFPKPVRIPAGHWFLMGDNRNVSADSRYWGPVPERQITGRVDDCTIAGLGLGCKAAHRP